MNDNRLEDARQVATADSILISNLRIGEDSQPLGEAARDNEGHPVLNRSHPVAPCCRATQPRHRRSRSSRKAGVSAGACRTARPRPWAVLRGSSGDLPDSAVTVANEEPAPRERGKNARGGSES